MNVLCSGKIRLSLLLILLTIIICFACTRSVNLNSDDNNKYDSITKLVNNINFYRDPQAVLIQIKEIARTLEEGRDIQLLGTLTLKEAECFNQLNNSDSTAFYAYKGLNIARELQDPKLEAEAYKIIGHFYASINDYVSANEYYLKANKYALRTKDPVSTAIILNSVGNVYCNLGDYAKSIQYLKLALLKFDSLNDTYRSGLVFLNLTVPYLSINDTLNYQTCYKKAYSILEKYHDTTKIARLLMNHSEYIEDSGDIESAIRLTRKATELSKLKKDYILYSVGLLNLGSYLHDANRIEDAKKSIESSLEVAKKINNYSVTVDALTLLADIESHNNNSKLAYRYLYGCLLLKDSLVKVSTKKEVTAINLQKALQKQEYESNALQKNLDFKIRQNTYLVFLVVFVILLGIIIILNYYRIGKLKDREKRIIKENLDSENRILIIEKKRLALELETKNKELVTHSLRLITKNDILSKISNLSVKYYENNGLTKECYNDFVRIVEENGNLDKEWDQFRVLFEEVHHNFFSNLKQSFPDLTSHDLRFCSYIKINLTTKEIAKLLNISPGTVRTFKYRLKIRFRLNPETSIEDFLRDI